MNCCAESSDTLLKAVKRDLIFGTVLLRSECRHYIFRNHLVKMLISAVGKSVGLQLSNIIYRAWCTNISPISSPSSPGTFPISSLSSSLAGALRAGRPSPRRLKSKSLTLSLSEFHAISWLDPPKYGNDTKRMNLSLDEPGLGSSGSSSKSALNETPVLKWPSPSSARTLREYASMKAVSPSCWRPSFCAIEFSRRSSYS